MRMLATMGEFTLAKERQGKAMLLVSETFVNATEHYRISDKLEPYEAWTDDAGKLFRTLQREYGKCIGSVYVDGEGGKPQKIGWVFQKRAKYEDTKESYLQEVWITLHTAKDTVTREEHYHILKG